MSPAPSYNQAERRARIRILTRGGQGLDEISRAVGLGQRTVLSVLTSPETDYERDVADLLQGWSPDCMEPAEWADWQRMNTTNALKPCWDCPLDFAVEMRAVDRCNGTPGQRYDTPMAARTPIAFHPPPDPETEALLERARAFSPVEALFRDRDPEPEEEPVMSIDDAPAHDPEPQLQPEEVDVRTALELLGFAAGVAGEAWRKKVEAAEIAIAADEEWAVAQGKLVSAWELVGIGPRLLDALVDRAERVIDQGLAREVLEEARASVALDGETQDVGVVESTARSTNIPETIPVAAPTPHQRREAEARSASLTPRQAKVLAGLKAGKSRADIARDLGVVYQSVDGMLEAMAKKGLLPTELIAGLPARFARYATVRS